MSHRPALDGLAPEFRALVLALRRRLHPKADADALGADALHAALAAVADWPALLAGARRHRIATLVWPTLGNAPAGLVPPGAARQLRAMAQNNLYACLAQIAELHRLLPVFAQADCPVLTLKGLPLSQALYGDAAQRGAGDIDLLVAPADLPRADALLRGAGYVQHQGRLAPATLRHCKEVLYRHPAGHGVELHQRLLHNPALLPHSFAELWDRRDTVLLGGKPVDTLPAAVLPHYLMLHGTYHCWDRLCWLADLHVLLQHPDDRARAMAEAAALGLAAPMALTLELADGWLGGAGIGSATHRTIRHFFSDARWLERPRRGGPSWVLRETRRRGRLYRLKGTWRHFAQEMAADIRNPVDAEFLHLPSALSWLYPLLRPLGWVVRNLRRHQAP